MHSESMSPPSQSPPVSWVGPLSKSPNLFQNLRIVAGEIPECGKLADKGEELARRGQRLSNGRKELESRDQVGGVTLQKLKESLAANDAELAALDEECAEFSRDITEMDTRVLVDPLDRPLLKDQFAIVDQHFRHCVCIGDLRRLDVDDMINEVLAASEIRQGMIKRLHFPHFNWLGDVSRLDRGHFDSMFRRFRITARLPGRLDGMEQTVEVKGFSKGTGNFIFEDYNPDRLSAAVFPNPRSVLSPEELAGLERHRPDRAGG